MANNNALKAENIELLMDIRWDADPETKWTAVIYNPFTVDMVPLATGATKDEALAAAKVNLVKLNDYIAEQRAMAELEEVIQTQDPTDDEITEMEKEQRMSVSEFQMALEEMDNEAEQIEASDDGDEFETIDDGYSYEEPDDEDDWRARYGVA